ncbi:MAG: transglutaminase family protein [Bacteroidales bacterium]
MNNATLLNITDLLKNCDEETFELIVKQFKKDKDARTASRLKNMWFNSRDLDVKHKLEKLISALQYKEIEVDIKQWLLSEDKDLMELLLTINKVEYKLDDQSYIVKNFERLKQDIWLELNESLTPLEQFSVMSHMLFKEYGFVVDDGKANIMGNYLSTVLEYRRGGIFMMSILYLITARNLGLNVSFVDYVDYPLLAYVDLDIARMTYSDDNYSPIIFYINLADEGKIVTREQMTKHLNERCLHNSHNYKDICSDIVIIGKLLENLGAIYKKRNKTKELEEIAAIYKLLKI